MVQVATNFIAAGGNRQPNAADWDQHGSGLLAYGAGNNIALWDPLVSFIFTYFLAHFFAPSYFFDGCSLSFLHVVAALLTQVIVVFPLS